MEILANELILDIFEYLSSTDLIHSFNNLNNRFDNLIIDYFHIHKCFDFRLGNKADIQLTRRRYLPSFIDQIEHLHLSDADTNPHEIDFFLSRLYPFYRFENLKSISLEHIYSIEKLDRLIDDFQRLSYLTDLRLQRCFIQADQQSILTLMNKIWSLSNLITLHLGISYDDHNHFIPPTMISCSIRHLFVQGTECVLGNLSILYENTPSLETLSLKLWSYHDDDNNLNPMLTLTRFSCQSNNPSISFLTLLRHMPNLRDLTIHVNNSESQMDGNYWQSIIRKHLLQLKNFQLKMEINLSNVSDTEREINRIIDTYRTSFWINQNQWFIRCFWNEDADRPVLHLHTLPYRFKHLSLQLADDFRTETTCPNEDLYQHYNCVKNLTFSSCLSESNNLLNISFRYLRHLSLSFPMKDTFRQYVPQLDHLVSLEVQILDWNDDDEDLIQLQDVLDQAPRLFSIQFQSWPTSSTNVAYQSNKKSQKTITKMAPFSNENTSVRQLDLRGLRPSRLHHFYNEQQCLALTRTPLGSQCEYLQIEVEKRTNIVDLVKKMPKLRTLNVRCQDRKHNDQELIKWLQNHLPSSCSVAKDSLSPNDIRLWIR